MLNGEQAKYIDELRKTSPALPESELRGVLAGAAWPEHEIQEALTRFTGSSVGGAQVVPTPQASEPSLPTTPTKRTGTYVRIGLILLCVLGIGGAGGYYILHMKERPTGFPKLTEETILTHLLTKFGDIDTATYGLSTKLRVVPREKGVRSYEETVTVSEEEKLKYKRDQDRFRDIESIRTALKKYEVNPYSYEPQTITRTAYPRALTGIPGIRITDAQGTPYIYTVAPDQASYTLTVTFETDDAARIARAESIYAIPTVPTEYTTASTSPMVNDPASKTVTIPNSTYLSTYSFTGEPPKPRLFGFFDLSDIESFIPDNFEGSLTVGGSLDTRTDKPADANLTIDGSVTFGDAQFALSAEGIKKGDTYFGILHKIPTFFSMLSQLRGQWVEVTEEDLKSYGLMESYAYLIPEDEDEREKKRQMYAEQLTIILEVASSEKVFTIVDGPRNDTFGETTLEAYELSTDSETIASFYKTVTARLESYGDESLITYDPATYTYLTSTEFKNSLEYVRENTRLTLWFNDFGYPAQAEFYVRHVPSEDARALKESQIELVFTWTLDGINERISIDTPEESISFDELMMELTGKTKEEVRSDRQSSNIESLRYNLDAYHEWTGTYPQNLNDLLKKRAEVTPSSSGDASFYNSDYYKDLPFATHVPQDLFTEKPFVYTSSGNDYTLAYEMKLAPYTPKKNPSDYYTFYRSPMAGSDYGLYSLTLESTLVPKYNDGTNYADKTRMSQAEATYADKDSDKLSDALETIFGTNPTNRDSDNDGFQDGEEIYSGSNPLGPGKLEYDSYGGGLFY